MSFAVSLAEFREAIPTPEEIDGAAEALSEIELLRDEVGRLPLGEALLSKSLTDLLSELLSVIARGQMATIAPVSKSITTQEAADLLNVSRPYLIKLLEKGDLGYDMVGTHRRLSLGEVLEYKARRSAERKAALREMQEIAEDLE